MTKEEKILEEAGVEVPPFSEKEFIRKELISFKTTLVLFVFSIILAGASFLVWRAAGIPFAALFLGALAVGFLLLRPAFKVTRIDISHWKRKEWVGTMFLYFFFWLGFFLLFTNPPLSDSSAPRIQVGVTPAVQSVGDLVELGAYVGDNVGIRGDPQFCVLLTNGTVPAGYAALSDAERQACSQTWTREGEKPIWRSNVTPTQAGTYAGFVLAEDKSSQRAELAFNFTVISGAALGTVEPPRDRRFDVSTDYLSVKPDARLQDLLAIQYRIDNGTWYNFAKDENANRQGFWITNPAFPGWKVGANFVQIRAVEQPKYLEVSGKEGFRLPGGIVEEPRSWHIAVKSDYAGLGTAEEPRHVERRFIASGQTPGPGALIGFGALLALALFLRRRSPDA